MALAQLCDQPEHPLMFLDRLDPGDADFLDEVARAPDEQKGWPAAPARMCPSGGGKCSCTPSEACQAP
jgi:hypothetical protein